MQIILRPFASLNPRTTAELRPRSAVLTIIRTLYPSCCNCSTVSALPSRELSSTTITSTSSNSDDACGWEANAWKSRVTSGRRLAFSLYAGTMMEDEDVEPVTVAGALFCLRFFVSISTAYDIEDICVPASREECCLPRQFASGQCIEVLVSILSAVFDSERAHLCDSVTTPSPPQRSTDDIMTVEVMG